MNLSKRQLQVLLAVCKLNGASCSEIHRELKHLYLARTTVSTMLGRLKGKGYLDAEKIGNQLVYYSCISEIVLKERAIDSLVDTLFQGDRKALVRHILLDKNLNGGSLELGEC